MMMMMMMMMAITVWAVSCRLLYWP